MRIFVEKL